MEHIEFSLILPAYNQKRILEGSIAEIIKTFGNICELIIVDDGSVDNTHEAIKYIQNVRLIRNTHNMGKGYSVKTGMLSARGEYRIFTDADLPYGTKGIKDVLKKLKNGYDVAIGHRENPYPDSIFRLMGHRIFNAFAERNVRMPFKDTQCGLKGFKSSAAEAIFSRLSTNGFAFDIEALYLAMMLRYNICVVDAKQISRGLSTITINDVFRMFADVRKIKKIYIKQ
ncbi:glycosyltransferase [Dissulfurispira sp.]|uniref:glycosyltransferase n=1 Tax=Dissulfurispira sp. TaxID=2817609 RepID=UPI002FD91F4C